MLSELELKILQLVKNKNIQFYWKMAFCEGNMRQLLFRKSQKI